MDDPAVKKYTSLSLKLASLGLVIAAGSFWASAGVNSRPKYRDEQTLVGGTVWSQILIPLGILLSMFVGEQLDAFIQGYFMVSGIVMLWSTGLILVVGETLAVARRRRFSRETSALQDILATTPHFYDRIYMTIGVLSLLAGLITLADFIVLLM